MITFVKGNLLESRAEALVNAVNTVGVMGKGIALTFKERFPENFRLYAAACKAGEVRVGKMFVTESGDPDGPKWIVNFPTKQHWRNPSQLSWVQEGLLDLRQFLLEARVKSIAIPALGAGNGGLSWPEVREQIQLLLGEVESEILVYEPIEQSQSVTKRTSGKN